jgi:hypothetical protein
MNGSIRLGFLALAAAGLLTARQAAAQAGGTQGSLQFMAGGGLGYGTGGVHAKVGDSKPGTTLLGRVGATRDGRPFLVADGEWQLYRAPIPFPADATCQRSNTSDCPATDFGAFSVLGGVALFPAREFYVLPQVGAQFRSVRGYRASEYGKTGLAAGVSVGYLLGFGTGVSVSPEVFFRYATMTGPNTPSFRSVGFRVMAIWTF